MVSRVNQDSHDGENEEKVFHSVFVQFGSTDQRCVDWWLSMIAHIGRDRRGRTFSPCCAFRRHGGFNRAQERGGGNDHRLQSTPISVRTDGSGLHHP